ncbi:aminotransferase class IV, partial [Streptomyces prunicolor]|uniref:aminotransferase class IV n=1 Tax=Streptomyces prunicolor TaxID=67348 RepID=UPI0033E79A05
MKIWLDGGLQDIESARVSVFDHGLTVGDGVFETVKATDGETFALTRHLDRLTRSARGLGLPDPDLDEVRRGCAAVLDANLHARRHRSAPDHGRPRHAVPAAL